MDIEDEMKCYLTGVPDGKYIKKKKKGRGNIGRYND